MNEIEQLIKQLCPNGVEYRKLGEVCTFQRGTTITAKEAIKGNVPVLAGGQKPAYYHNQANRTGQTIVVAGSGAYAGYVSWWEQPIFVSDAFSVNPNEDLFPKYVFHFLKNIQQKIYGTKKGGGVPHVHGRSIAAFEIPVPPQAIQQKIVKILDKFTELEARRKQYEHYRNKLLTFTPPNDQNVRWCTLGEVGTMIRGNGIQKKDFTKTGVGCIHYGQIYTRYGTAAEKTISFIPTELAKKCKKAKKGDLVIATTSENVEDVCKAVVWQGEDDIAISGDAYIFRHNQDPKYVAYLFQTEQFLNYKKMSATGTKVIRVSGDNMLRFSFAFPPLSEQRRIAAILDKFEALTTSLQDGLPAEIEARRLQYRHYREQLLAFRRKA